MIGNFESALENSNIKGKLEINKNMEAERPMIGIEQPFSEQSKKDIVDFDNMDFTDSERPADYLPGEPRSFTDSDLHENKYGIDEKKELQERTGWPNEVVNKINSMEEAEIYEKADLKSVESDGKCCLIRSDIDLDQEDEDGISNRQRMERGRPPITKDGQEVELHHIGQKQDSPLAELTMEEHRGTGNDTILHDKAKESEIDRVAFAKERKDHWKSRVNS